MFASALILSILSLSTAQAKDVRVVVQPNDQEVVHVIIRPQREAHSFQGEWDGDFLEPGVQVIDLHQGYYRLFASNTQTRAIFCREQEFEIPVYAEDEVQVIIDPNNVRAPCQIILPEPPAELELAAALSDVQNGHLDNDDPLQGQSGYTMVEVTDNRPPRQHHWPEWLDLGANYRFEAGSHGDGRDRSPGSYYTGGGGGSVSSGNLQGFRITGGFHRDRYQLRGYFIWGLDNWLPLDEEVSMAGGLSPGYRIQDRLTLWLNLGYQVRGVFMDLDGYFYNNFQGGTLGPEVDIHFPVLGPMEVHVGPEFNICLGIYENKASAWFLALNLGLGL